MITAVEFRALPKSGPKRNKYGAKRTVVDGLAFDSAGEARRWGDLKIVERAGLITDLSRQVPFNLTANGLVIGRIVVDFTYRRRGQFVAEDFKSKATITPLFKWKAKHLAAEHGLKIEIVS